MLAHAPPNALAPQLQGLVGQVNWPMFFMRSAVRGVVLWPIVHYIGGAGVVRSVAASALGGVALSGIELAFDSMQTAAAVAAAGGQPAQHFWSPLTSSVHGLGDGLSTPPPDVIDVPYSTP